ncbi:PREDICTED: uroplakin-3b-like protein [Bison bison bison]|uniref:Uroplakin-3b-like protein n=1 Tax=Bison bison bison TaxID=43346 RepID=A0A6P3IDV7_BISBB|nr:PREDICTED: uroplakin-3b-like protein [Bison bison bison]
MGLGRGQSPLLMALLLLLACLQMGMSLERISYVPQLSSATLAGRLTQSTFTLEQPRGPFSHPSISDSDAIWLVVAHSNATQKFTAPQKVEDTPVPADFPQRGYYLTLRASRALYPGGPVKFLVMSDRGPMAETEWSSETRLQQAEVLQAAPGPQTAGTVVIIAILSVLLAVLLAALLALLIFTWYDTCGSTPISGPGELVFVRKYDTHHMSRPSAVGGS